MSQMARGGGYSAPLFMLMLGWSVAVWGETDTQGPPTVKSGQRPAIGMYRWQENWSFLADPAQRTRPGDSLKYIPLSKYDPERYLSLGLTLRERFESNEGSPYNVDSSRNEYLLHRLWMHADIHFSQWTRAFVELENVLAPGLSHTQPPDANRLDLRLAFVDTHGPLGGLNNSLYKLRFGRQEMAFDLQRFIAVRNGPNVRQAFDAAWGAIEIDNRWRMTGFVSQPVKYNNSHAFDDSGSSRLQYGGARVERKFERFGRLSATISFYKRRDAHFLTVEGREFRRNFDLRYGGNHSGFDWDIEGLYQSGHVDNHSVAAWGLGAIAGYTFEKAAWKPRIGFQFDAASGDRDPDDERLNTFNPLFPNGSYLTLAGYTGFVNFLHFRPSLSITPIKDVTLTAGIGGLWRQTTQDAIYTTPSVPMSGTAGRYGKHTSTYGQLKAQWKVSRSLSLAMEYDHYHAASAVRKAGGNDSNYFMVEVNWGW